MRVYLKHDNVRHGLFWWGANPKDLRYPIHERKIQAALDPEPRALEKLAKYRVKFNELYRNNRAIVEFEGQYSRDDKKLTLKVN